MPLHIKNPVLILPTPRKTHVVRSLGARRRKASREGLPPAPGPAAAVQGRGFVLQGRACGAKGGNRQPGPSYRPGGQRSTPGPRSPSSHT